MIALKDVSFRYSSETEYALEDICLRVDKGQVLLLLGASGCGKTTITRLINGLVPGFYEGTLRGNVSVDGKKITNQKIQDLAGIMGSVFQDPRSQFFATDVTAEIAFACENAGLPMEEINRRIQETTKDLQIQHLLGKSIFKLSSGEKQSVAIASVYAFSPKIIVMDEPSANLDTHATEKLRKTIETLRQKGFTIIISEHRIHYLKELVDQAIFVQDGKIRKLYKKEEFQLLTNTVANRLGLRSLNLKDLTIHEKPYVCNQETILSVKDVAFGYVKKRPIFEKLSFDVGRGEILGIVGQNGIGKSTLLELICGLQKEQKGSIAIHGSVRKPKQRIKETYLVMQDSDYQLFTESVESELFLGNNPDEASKKSDIEILKRLGLMEFMERHPASLSGGQKQRLSIAVAYMKDTDIICFDEPTSGLDYNNMVRIRDLFQSMAADGKAILVISHDYEFLLSTCTKLLNIQDGHTSKCFKMSEKNQHLLAEAIQAF